jgi:hypothetical protein
MTLPIPHSRAEIHHCKSPETDLSLDNPVRICSHCRSLRNALRTFGEAVVFQRRELEEKGRPAEFGGSTRCAGFGGVVAMGQKNRGEGVTQVESPITHSTRGAALFPIRPAGLAAGATQGDRI